MLPEAADGVDQVGRLGQGAEVRYCTGSVRPSC